MLIVRCQNISRVPDFESEVQWFKSCSGRHDFQGNKTVFFLVILNYKWVFLIKICCTIITWGEIYVDLLTGSQEVVGSIPISSTICYPAFPLVIPLFLNFFGFNPFTVFSA